MLPKSYVIYQGSDDWSALYEDGKLVRVSDHYLVAEELYTRLGITVVQSDDFLRGSTTRQGVAPTLDELEAYREEKDSLLAEAEALRARAAELEKQASSILASPQR